jgi:N-terminal domain of toast_rack, DUF2154/Domain of unknown function (DUF5668)
MAQNERPPLVVPILLIAVGAIFLYANYRPAFDPWPVLRTYWPLILIFVGVGKIWDSAQRRNNPGAASGFSIGTTIGVLAFVVVLIVLLWHGRSYSREHQFASMHHEVRTIDGQNAKSAEVSVDAGAGQVTVSGGSSHLLDADFRFTNSFDNPRVDYNVSNGVGQLNVSQDGQGTHTHYFMGVSHNDWNLRLGNDIPLELRVNMGAGQGTFHLRDLPLTHLEVEMGAGQVEVDLTGDRKKDLDAELKGGVGEATVRLPKNVGVVVQAHGGIGAVNAHGLKHEDDQYTNDAYGKTPATIHLTVQGGIGSISLIQEP